MGTPGQKLAESLKKLKELQDSGIIAIKAGKLSRVHRERLADSGFIREVVRGWYVAVPPNEQPGDSTTWYVSFWGFCAGYLLTAMVRITASLPNNLFCCIRVITPCPGS